MLILLMKIRCLLIDSKTSFGQSVLIAEFDILLLHLELLVNHCFDNKLVDLKGTCQYGHANDI